MIASIASAFLSLFLAQQPPAAEPAKPAETPKPLTEQTPVVTKHEIHANGTTLNYTAAAGMMPIKNPPAEIGATLFFVAYTLDGIANSAKRPLMFSFNG